MARLAGHGLALDLPAGWEGRIFRRDPIPGTQAYPLVQVATFPLPNYVGDFGGGATPLMGDRDVFAVLAEYGPESVGTALFARQGMPRHLDADDFKPYLLRRGVRKQAGTQWFFTEAGRPFTLYAVLGAYAGRHALIGPVNDLLAGVAISATAGQG